MFVSQTEAQSRYDICKLCDSFDSDLFTCAECGCQMKIKVKFIVSSCPLNKWSMIQQQDKF